MGPFVITFSDTFTPSAECAVTLAVRICRSIHFHPRQDLFWFQSWKGLVTTVFAWIKASGSPSTLAFGHIWTQHSIAYQEAPHAMHGPASSGSVCKHLRGRIEPDPWRLRDRGDITDLGRPKLFEVRNHSFCDRGTVAYCTPGACSEIRYSNFCRCQAQPIC